VNKILNYNAKAGPGFEFPSKTFILEDKDQILIISPSLLDDETMAFLKQSNKKVSFIAPNNFHNIYLSSMQILFPEAMFYGPKRSAKQSGVKLLPTSELHTNDFVLIEINGCDILSETCFFHKPTKTLYVADLFFNMHHKMNLPMKLMMKFVGGYHQLNTSRTVRMGIKDKKQFLKSIEQLLTLDVEKAIPCHGDEIDKDQFTNWANSLIQSLV